MLNLLHSSREVINLARWMFSAEILGSAPSKLIFIIGTGRSGTHWVGHILHSHPDVSVTIEKEPMFSWVTQMALDPAKRSDLFSKLVRRYRYEAIAVRPKIYADKSHPNIWIADKLANTFPQALFIGVIRDVYPTVASMLKHQGVLSWIHDWETFSIPNEFLGITQNNIHKYRGLSLAGKCAVRWVAHRKKLIELGNTLEDRIFIVDYKNLQLNTKDELSKMRVFLNLDSSFPVPNVKHESLDRWREELNERNIEDIENVLREFVI